MMTPKPLNFNTIINLITLITLIIGLIGLPFKAGQRLERLQGQVDNHSVLLQKNEIVHDKFVNNFDYIKENYVKKNN